ncbi:hypothetical protein BT96DRAFT_947146 [Gymnopus androsaceus JB14]|uniref:Ubiquitin-like protease family profile domain-containing protein n=1 Tax=Gymnopus androsaceus JB14 TaxID=1447944 RepID=A0A6A4GUH8_9AGAR|nr:hypothetical protein BT96DRAFT_947146 [Gymnopus androsaceus JB14]
MTISHSISLTCLIFPLDISYIDDQLWADTLKYGEAAKQHAGFSCLNKIFVPVHKLSGHWYLVLINYEGKTIKNYDSWYPTYSKNFGQAVEYLENTPLMLKGEEYFLADFQNDDSVDCGIHVLDNLNGLLQGKDLNGKNKRMLPHPTDQKLTHLQHLLLVYKLHESALPTKPGFKFPHCGYGDTLSLGGHLQDLN